MADETDSQNERPAIASPPLPKRIESHIQRKTLAGLLEMVPLIVTILVLLFVVEHADSFVRILPFVEGQPWDFTGVGLIVVIVSAYLLGLFVSTVLGKKLMWLQDTILNGIPVIKTIYGVTQQATRSLTSQYDFSRVVFVEWPREGMIALGFVTGHVRAADGETTIVLVYIPTVPNPTSGNMAFVVEDDVIETDLTVEAAMKLVFSGGIVLPQSISLARIPMPERTELAYVGRFENPRK